MTASSQPTTAKVKKNWHQLCYQLGFMASCLQDFYENASESEDGRGFTDLSDKLLAVSNILSITTKLAVQNETYHALAPKGDVSDSSKNK